MVVRNEGLNIIAAEHHHAARDDAQIDKRGLFASLTFLGQPHHE